MKTLFFAAGSTLVALGCATRVVEASQSQSSPAPEHVAAEMEQSAATLQQLASTLATLDARQAQFVIRMGGLFGQLPARHAALDAVARGIGELEASQAAWGQQMEAGVRASEPNWALLASWAATRE